jgi:hypothetical protein
MALRSITLSVLPQTAACWVMCKQSAICSVNGRFVSVSPRHVHEAAYEEAS